MSAWVYLAIVAGFCIVAAALLMACLVAASRADDQHAAATDDLTGDLDEPPAREVTA